ncbi:hypothetical protein Moror_11943 [Moniliophthora roreri MCA 2997]|uniref:Uncharacterized protein n=1 Tax=Moniliophthora roreri (strain MCA 2997) TaxID=1381753 RepID=V2WZQ5_MONRO|nr:hypothetical protein Moror_11943 [Moniliophthora roreri MCA 2997]
MSGLGLAWAGMLIFDTMIFCLTLYRALSMRRVSRSLLTILLRDGTVYFAVMICVSLGNILTFFLGQGQIRGAPTTLTNVISSVMISRLMLNLRDPKILTATPNSTTIQYSGMMSTLAPTFNTSRQPRSRESRIEDTAEEIELTPLSNRLLS